MKSFLRLILWRKYLILTACLILPGVCLDVTGTSSNITLHDLTEAKALFGWWSVKEQITKALDRSKAESSAYQKAYENLQSAMDRDREIDDREKKKSKVALDIEKNKHLWYALGGVGAGLLVGVGLIALVNSATKMTLIPLDTGAQGLVFRF